MVPSTLPINLNVECFLEWSWVINAQRARPLLLSTFGDWFYQTEDGGPVHWLSLLDGDVAMAVAPDDQSFSQMLQLVERRDEWLLESFVERCTREGWTVGPTECLAWKTPPILGAQISFENIQVMDLRVYSSLQSQIHRQLRGLPGL